MSRLGQGRVTGKLAHGGLQPAARARAADAPARRDDVLRELLAWGAFRERFVASLAPEHARALAFVERRGAARGGQRGRRAAGARARARERAFREFVTRQGRRKFEGIGAADRTAATERECGPACARARARPARARTTCCARCSARRTSPRASSRSSRSRASSRCPTRPRCCRARRAESPPATRSHGDAVRPPRRASRRGAAAAAARRARVAARRVREPRRGAARRRRHLGHGRARRADGVRQRRVLQNHGLRQG